MPEGVMQPCVVRLIWRLNLVRGSPPLKEWLESFCASTHIHSDITYVNMYLSTSLGEPDLTAMYVTCNVYERHAYRDTAARISTR